MNGIDLFEKIKQVPFDEIMCFVNGKTLAETQSKRGNLIEKLWSLCIKFGFVKDLANAEYDHYEGNVNTCKLRKIDNLEIFLQRLSIFGGKGGSSDITLRHKITGKYLFMSSKFYLDDSKKSIDEYDVEKILAVVKHHAHKYTSYDIYLLVNDKVKVADLLSSCHPTNNYIKDNIHLILDLSDLKIAFNAMKVAVQNVNANSINETFCNTKIPLELRFHQDLITHKQMEKISEGEKGMLLGAKARSGKTYCVGGLFSKYYKKYSSLNALIITPAPTETISQFTDDLFHKFSDFVGINVLEIKKGGDSIITCENNIIIVSKQLLDDYVFEKKIEAISGLNLDFIIFDENHFHGTTQMSKDILQSYSSQKTIKLYLTATYAKPLCMWNIPTDCQFYWDIEDEQLCKNRNIMGLVKRHGDDVCRFLTDTTAEAKLSVYDIMPNLELITNIMDRKRYEIIKEQIKDTSYGFSNSTLLSGNFPGEVDAVLAYITGSNKYVDYPDRDLSIFGRIKQRCTLLGSRTKLNNGDFTSQLWFLPYGKNMTIDKVSEHLKDRMLKNQILAKYEIKIVNSKKDYKLKDIKEEIKNWELKAKTEGKDGLILLAGNQLTLGITLPYVDIVFLLNDVMASDKIIQMMYRCMTESMTTTHDKINDGCKKMGFVVDLNISRVINTLLDFNVSKDLTAEQKFTYLVENNLINVDSDLFENTDKSQLVEKLLHIWKADPINNFKSLLRKIEETIIDLDTHDQKLLNKYFTSANDDTTVKIQFDEDADDQPLPSGNVINCDNSICGDTDVCDDGDTRSGNTDDGDANGDTEDELTNNVSLTKDVLPFILPLSCILTMNHNNKDILEMINVIKSNPLLLSVFEDQSFIWWNKRDVIKLVEMIVRKYVKRSSTVYDVAIQFKLSLQSLIDRPKELLELIDSCLKPKQKEKQECGEVFTPMNLVFEMLDNLDKHYVVEFGRSIFVEAHFKWFDPAVGMGNFPVAIYLRLMDGLQSQMPDDEERKKHILENMLYMSELNKKNVFICHQIFNVNCCFKLNLHEGDTLKLDVSKWDLDRFDVIVGNPPYNKGGIRSHTGEMLGDKNETIWTKFVEKSLEWLRPDGFIAFINPLSWLKKSHSLHDVMLQNHIVWMKLWDNAQSKSAINAQIPISLYVLQKTPNDQNKKTHIVGELKHKKLVTSSLEYLNPAYSIPLAFHSIFNKLAVFIETRNLQLEYKTKTVKTTGTKTRIPPTYELGDWCIDTYTVKEGIMVKKADVVHLDASKRKLIIANKSSFAGAFIDEGKLGLTGNHKFYILGDNLELIERMLRFAIVSVVGQFTKYGQDFLDSDAFKFIPDIRKLGRDLTNLTEDAFYELVGLTFDEISQIKNLAR